MRLATRMCLKPLARPGAGRSTPVSSPMSKRGREALAAHIPSTCPVETRLPCLVFSLRLESTPTPLYLARRRQWSLGCTQERLGLLQNAYQRQTFPYGISKGRRSGYDGTRGLYWQSEQKPSLEAKPTGRPRGKEVISL